MRCDVRYYKASATGEYEIVQRKSIKAVTAELEATKPCRLNTVEHREPIEAVSANHNWSAATKRELIEAVCKELEATKSAAEETVNIVLQAIKDYVAAENICPNGARTEGFGFCWKKSRP
jgi:hypothetical protein